MTTNEDLNYAHAVDFGDGVPALKLGAPTVVKHAGVEAPTTNKLLCAFGVLVTVTGQALLALAIVLGGNPVVGLTCVVGLTGLGLAFAFAGAFTGADV